MSITPEMAQIIAEAIDDRLIDLHVSLPGRIQSYDAITQTATIEIMVGRLLENTDGVLTSEELPVLQNVPVVFPKTSKYLLSFPIEEGDTGDVIFAESSIGQWRATGAVSAPEDVGRCTLSGAKFYPGLTVDDDALTDELTRHAVFGRRNGVQLRVDDVSVQAVTTGAAADDFVAMSAKVDDFITKLDTVMRAGWVIPAAPDAGLALKTAYIAAFGTPPGSTKSTNLKAD